LKHLIALSNKYRVMLLAFLKPLGFWGVGLVALLDSSSIPVPMDLIVAGYAWSDPHRFYLSVLMASIGSAIGGLVPYFIGRAGGEIFLLKRINRQRFEAIRDRFERQEFLAVMIPSMMPPPAPWKVFVFASGVFEMRILDFLLAVFVGRAIRWFALALLVLKLGPGAADMVAHRALAAVALVGALAVAGFLWWWIRWKRSGKRLPN